jgi:hypothetical protein
MQSLGASASIMMFIIYCLASQLAKPWCFCKHYNIYRLLSCITISKALVLQQAL